MYKAAFLSISCLLLLSACGGKYMVRTYPTGAKVQVRDIQTKETKLVGLSPAEIPEENSFGDVFFVVLEKENFKKKEILVRAESGESLTISAQLDPLSPDEQGAGDGQKKDQGQPQKKKPKKDELEELKLRVALLENTVSFYKDAMFSARYKGNGQAKFDRDQSDEIVEKLFQAQQAILGRNYDTANELIDEAIKKDEYLSKAWLLKGSLKFLQRDYEGARLAWERTLKMDPYNTEAYQYLSKVYKILGVNELPKKPAALRYPASQVEIDKRQGL